jgi:hypothetical protein
VTDPEPPNHDDHGQRWPWCGEVDPCDHPALRRTQYDLADLEQCPVCGGWHLPKGTVTGPRTGKTTVVVMPPVNLIEET